MYQIKHFKQMKLRFILLSLTIILYSCAGNSAKISINNDPESITIQWLEWLDTEEFGKLKEISAGNMLAYVEDMEKFFEGSEEENFPVESTIVERIACVDGKDNQKECTYCCKEEAEETLILIKEKGQWKVTDVVSALEELDEEAIRQEKMLEEILNKKLPKESEEL